MYSVGDPLTQMQEPFGARQFEATGPQGVVRIFQLPYRRFAVGRRPKGEIKITSEQISHLRWRVEECNDQGHNTNRNLRAPMQPRNPQGLPEGSRRPQLAKTSG